MPTSPEGARSQTSGGVVNLSNASAPSASMAVGPLELSGDESSDDSSDNDDRVSAHSRSDDKLNSGSYRLANVNPETGVLIKDWQGHPLTDYLW